MSASPVTDAGPRIAGLAPPITAAPRPVRVLVADEHPVVRIGLTSLLAAHREIEPVGEAGTLSEALALAGRLGPDVAVLGARMPDAGGAEACRRLLSARPGVRVMMLASELDEAAVVGAVMAGASGYALRGSEPAELTAAVLEAARAPARARRGAAALLRELRARDGRESPDPSGLSPRERRIVALIAEGMTNRAIGQALHLAEKTVANDISRLLRKLGFRSRAQVAAWAGHRGSTPEGRPIGAGDQWAA